MSLKEKDILKESGELVKSNFKGMGEMKLIKNLIKEESNL